MTTIIIDRATVEQALEALERARPLKADYTTLEYFEEAKRKHYAAMAALRAALAQQAEPWERRVALAEQLQMQQAEPVEPVAKVELMMTGGNAGLATRIVEIEDHLRDRLRPGQLLYTAPPQRKPLTIERLRDALVASRIIPPAAVEDPEGYDDGVTLHRIEALHRRIT